MADQRYADTKLCSMEQLKEGYRYWCGLIPEWAIWVDALRKIIRDIDESEERGETYVQTVSKYLGKRNTKQSSVVIHREQKETLGYMPPLPTLADKTEDNDDSVLSTAIINLISEHHASIRACMEALNSMTMISTPQAREQPHQGLSDPASTNQQALQYHRASRKPPKATAPSTQRHDQRGQPPVRSEEDRRQETSRSKTPTITKTTPRWRRRTERKAAAQKDGSRRRHATRKKKIMRRGA